ncbi:MAG: LysM peptidoglycan-binding domain-containing protein [Verrucomicrobia bacterium]|nr:LysM peptidoglycan-binding domain-containing protein [Verrucomicrobiota bacterium]
MKRLLPILLLALSGCQPVGTNPEQSAAYNQARKSADAGEWKAAVAFYRQTLDEHPRFARAHLELALLYDEKLNDPIGAIYHYRRYLDLEPNSDKRRVVDDFIERARLSLASKLPQNPGTDVNELLRLQQQNTALASEVAALKTKLAGYEAVINAPALPAPTDPTPPTPTPNPAKPRTHVVAKGDTLHSLALRYYGTRAGWEKIYQANRATVPVKDQLRVGQSLVIP